MSKYYIEFTNKGEVPVNAFKLLGASSKRGDDSKIGYFGTGLKYALAVLLREDIKFKIYSGEQEIKIGTRKTKFLDQVVTVITVNGEKTSITLEAGINWETWFAIREIYSNTVDESGTMKTSDKIEPKNNTTKIYIEGGDKLKNLFENWSDYFSNKRLVISGEKNKVLQKTTTERLILFRKGIRAYTNRTKSVFDYDVDKVKINESRVVENDYEARQRAAEALAQCNDTQALEHFIHSSSEVYEKQPEFWSYLFDDSFGKFDQAWYEALKDYRIVPAEYAGFYGITNSSITLPEKLCKHLYKQFKDKLQIMGSTKEQYILTNADPSFLQPSMASLATVGFAYDFSRVKIAKFKDSDVLGQFDKDNNLILISERLLEPVHQNKWLSVLFEEVAHAKSGYSDNTREFQDYIIQLACALIGTRK